MAKQIHATKGQMTRHHLIPKSRKDDYKKKTVCETRQVLKLWEKKHQSWHFLFGNCTLDEIILTLQRIKLIKFPN